MDDVAKKQQFGWLIEVTQCLKAADGIVWRMKREHLAAMAMGPIVTDVKVCNRKNAKPFEPDCPPRIDPDSRFDLQA